MGVVRRARFFVSLLKNKVTRGRVPLVVVLNTTFHCNMRCGYCYGEFFNQPPSPDFTTEELTGLINELGDMGTRSITLGGGEPLIRKDIGTIIECVKANGIECGFNTNGVLIPKRINELKKADMICVSIDGPREMNDKNRGEGSFDQIIHGMEVAIDNGIKVHTTTVITEHNCDCVDWIVDMAQEKGIQAEFNFLFHQSQGKTGSDRFMSNNDKLRKAANRVVERKAQGAPILFSEQVYRYVSDWPDYQKRLFMNRKPEFKHPKCYAGRFMMFINSDGKVYPCVQLLDCFNGLDFRQVGIKKAWDNCNNHNCKACYFPCFNEFNNIMEMNPKVIGKQIVGTLTKGH